MGLRDDAVAAFFWVANWMFVADKTDYFAQGAPPSPLQHAWSLGVEEQYYIVWPLVLVAVAVVLAARARRQDKRATLGAVRLTVFLLATLGALGSAAAAILLASDATRDRVYFGTDTRAQALLVGAAASALLVGDWSVAESRMVADPLPVGQVDRPGASGDRPGVVGAGRSLRHRQRPRIPQRPADRGRRRGGVGDRPGGAGPARTGRHRAGVGSAGVAGHASPTASTCGIGRSFWCSTVSGPDGTGSRCSRVRCAATLAVSVVSWWAIEQPVRKWRPVRVPLLPLAGATAATAAAVTLLVVPVVPRPGVSALDASLPPGVSPVAVVSPSPAEGVRPARAVANETRIGRSPCRCSATRSAGR